MFSPIAFFISLFAKQNKKKAEEKLGCKINKLTRKKDGVEVDDDDVFMALVSEEKEVWLIASKNGVDYDTFETVTKKNLIEVSTLNDSKSMSVAANSLASLKMQGINIRVNEFYTKISY